MNEYSDNNFCITLDEGFVSIVYKKEEYSYEDIDMGVKKRLELTNGNEYPVFADFRCAKFGTSGAMKRFSEPDASQGVSRVAILIDKPINKLIFNFFFSLYKPTVPMKLFNNKNQAIIWLKQNNS